jgi:hypothetical protein
VWRQWFIPKITQHKSLSESDLDQIPVFTFREEPYSLVLGHILESLAGLSLLTGILIALSYAIMWRYRVAG